MDQDAKEVVIKDACILIDLIDLDLLNKFFKLELISYTTPFVVQEITDETQYEEINRNINDDKLIVDSEGEVLEIQKFFEMYPGLSVADCSVLELSIRKEATILSSDGSLRKISKSIDVKVCGLLWVIETLYNESILSKTETLEKLKIYKNINSRAPIKEINHLINKITN